MQPSGSDAHLKDINTDVSLAGANNMYTIYTRRRSETGASTQADAMSERRSGMQPSGGDAHMKDINMDASAGANNMYSIYTRRRSDTGASSQADATSERPTASHMTGFASNDWLLPPTFRIATPKLSTDWSVASVGADGTKTNDQFCPSPSVVANAREHRLNIRSASEGLMQDAGVAPSLRQDARRFVKLLDQVAAHRKETWSDAADATEDTDGDAQHQELDAGWGDSWTWPMYGVLCSRYCCTERGGKVLSPVEEVQNKIRDLELQRAQHT